MHPSKIGRSVFWGRSVCRIMFNCWLPKRSTCSSTLCALRMVCFVSADFQTPIDLLAFNVLCLLLLRHFLSASASSTPNEHASAASRLGAATARACKPLVHRNHSALIALLTFQHCAVPHRDVIVLCLLWSPHAQPQPTTRCSRQPASSLNSPHLGTPVRL